MQPLSDRSHSRPSVELQHSLQSKIAAIAPSVDLVMNFVSKFRKQDGSEANIEIALHEALANAVVHGNHKDPDKLVYVVCRCSIDGEVSVTIRDQGQGFDCRSIPDPTAPENRMCAHGRGIYVMQASMDEVAFDEGGVVVHMRKKSNALGDRAQPKGSLGKVTAEGAGNLATLHPGKAGADLGKGAAGAGKDVGVGAGKGAGKIGEGQ